MSVSLEETQSNFVVVLKRLSASAEEQIDYLKGLSDSETALPVDELALEFDEVYSALEWRADEIGWSPDAKAMLSRLDAQLDNMSGSANASLWDPNSLKVAIEWGRVRELARGSLEKLALSD